MKLLECYIENFGKLSAYKHTFYDGLNVIVGKNGSGKTTLSVFIKSMLYGLDGGKKTRSEENDRKRYLPWQGGRYGGSLSFETDGKLYRIERSFGEKPSADTFLLFNAKTGAPSSDFSESIGEELFGIDADGFERTVFLSEKKLGVRGSNQTISAKLSNLVGVDGDMGNFDKAIEMLEKKEKQYRHRRGGGGLIGEIKSDISAIDAELYSIGRKRDEYNIAENELASAQIRAADAEKKKNELLSKKLEGAYKKEYDAKIKAQRYYEEKIEREKEFFHGKAVNQQRLREFEEKHNRLRLLEADNFKKEALSAEEISEEIKKSDEHIETYNIAESANNVNKSCYLWLFLSLAVTGLSLLLGALVSPFLFLIFLLALPSLYMLLKTKASLSRGEKIKSELLLPVFDFVFEKTGRRVGEDSLYIALLEIKAALSSKLREAESLSAREKERNEEVEALRNECADFLSDFSLTSSDPFGEIREHIATYEVLLNEIAAKTREAELYAKEYSIVPGAAAAAASEEESRESLLKSAEAELKLLRDACYSLESKCLLLSDEISREDEIKEKRLELTDALSKAESTHRLIIKASEHLSSAKERLTEKYLGKMRSAFDLYMNRIAAEPGNIFAIDTDFSIRKTENGLTNQAESYSLGTKELYALITRLALTDALYEESSPFIVLDDPFCHFDDKKCKAALGAISSISKERQIIYLTCSETRTPD